MMSVQQLEQLVGRTFPEGSFVLDANRNAAFVGAIHGDTAAFTLPPGVAHPMFAHLATHCGMGVTLQEFFDMADADMDSGVLFGEGILTYDRVLRVDTTYRVTGGVSRVERKVGRRTGTFDAITVELELFDGETRVCSSEETYVFPRTERETG